ncbi:MAG: GNAT family N-acetyltransferase [Pseudonocardiales bacterium]
MGDPRVRRAGAADLPAVFSLRREVFTVGQGVPANIERDDRDAGAVHVVAERNGTVVGTGRLVVCAAVGIVGRMAVASAARGAGVGAALLSALEVEAAAAGLSAVELHAQVPARGFYERAGYTAAGRPYLEAGIEHVTMRKPLPVVRPAEDGDSADLIELIATCWAAYPGCVLDVDGEEPWLRAPATAYREWAGSLWIATLDRELVACVGYKPQAGCDELKSLYVAPSARRRGLGERLTRLVEQKAARRGAGRLILWSDTRFTDAHRLYERLGYRRLPGTRELHDLSQSVEYGYVKLRAP